MSYPRLANPPSANDEETGHTRVTHQLLGVFSQLNMGVIAFHPKGHTVYCTTKLAEILGVSPANSSEFLGAIGTSEVTREQVRQALGTASDQPTDLEIYVREIPLKLTMLTLEGEPTLSAVIVADQSEEQKKKSFSLRRLGY